jgi:hypothetical protein
MSEQVFDRETLLDLMVNVIPLGIIGFFIVLFAVNRPFGYDPLTSGLQFGIVGLTFVGLVILTYYAGKAISKAENEGDHHAASVGDHATEEPAEPVDAAGE